MNLISDFICSVVGQRLTLILLFAAFALNLLVLVMKLAELFCRPFEADCGEADDFPGRDRSDGMEDDREGLAS
ncbi:hypothetical protein ACJ8MI_05170 [Bifidobacterium adolescentis]|uniref:hypothetical protein n=1 Tax=Bifidobacterium adolescentis TaxID=1680 RepID=UPI003B9B9E5A